MYIIIYRFYIYVNDLNLFLFCAIIILCNLYKKILIKKGKIMADKKVINNSILNDDLNIVPFLYNSSSLEELLTKYSSALRSTDNLNDLLHSNKIIEFSNILLDNKFLSMIRTNYNCLYTLAKKENPDLKFYLSGRRKDVIGAEKKINLYLSQNRDLSDFKDELAFRFILFNGSIKTCYELMKTVIDFHIEKGFIPCLATPVFQTEGFKKEDFPDIEIPEESFLPPQYQLWVKDYVLHPKATGYQSLHVVFQDPKTGRCFEIQIRTFKMHIHAESNSLAGHDAYKKQRYADTSIKFDRSKIHMEGYAFADGQIFDFIGLEKPYQIIQRGRPF